MTDRHAWAFALAVGLVTMIAMATAVPFSDDTGTGERLFFSGLIGLLAAYGAWSFAGLVPLARDIAGWVRGRSAKAAPASPGHIGPLPELSPSRKTTVRRIVTALSAHGIFAPETPDPALLYAGIADRDESVAADVVFGALCEVDYYHPGTDIDPYFGNLILFDSKIEQTPDYLRAHIADLARIAGDGFTVTDVAIDAEWPREGRVVPVSVTMAINGEPLTIAYAGDVKYHSTHIAVAMARALDAAQTGRRLAAMWTDQGFWMSGIAADSIDALNTALKRTPRHNDYWNWVSEWTPFGASDGATV